MRLKQKLKADQRKRKQLLQQLNKDNRGVSILEIVIAVAILVALSIPVIRAITASAKYQYRSHIRQDITTNAQSLMEIYKAYSKEELEENQLSQSTITVDGLTFNVDVKIKPRISFPEITKLEDFDKRTCAYGLININRVALESFIKDDFARNAEDFLNLLNAHEQFYVEEAALTVDDIDYSKLVLLSRTLIVDISNSSASYEMRCKYAIKEHPYFKDELGTQKGYLNSSEYEGVILGKQSIYSGNALKRIYIYYYPVYDTTDYSFEEEIQINNSGSDALSLYLIKQVDEDTGASVSTYEQSYCPRVKLSGNTLNLYHNFDENIGGSNANDKWKSEVNGFKNANNGEPLKNAITQVQDETNTNTVLYDIDITITKDGEEWATLSSTVKK